jgi:hypothetical protein
MESGFEHQWRLARTHEIEHRPLEAKAIYEKLLEEDARRLYVALRLSAIEQALDHYLAARKHVLHSAELVRNSRWNDLAIVTHRLLAFDEQRLVRDLILGVDWTHRDVIRNSAVLSQHLWLTGNVREALDLIRAVEPRVRPSAQLSYSKANALRYLGRLDEAEAEYERCIRLAPGFADAHWSLSSHRKARPPGSRVPRILDAQQQYPPGAPEQPFFFYALFREYEDAGDAMRAWSSLQAGARLKRESLLFDPVVETEVFRALEALVTRQFVGTAASSGECVPIFILGMPRTGTTLVERILGGHSMVSAGGELNDFDTALCIATDQFRRAMPEDIERIAAADFHDVGRIYQARTAFRANGKRFLTDKNPANFVHAGFIAKALPNAKIICLRRDPMDACFSNFKELFVSEAYGYSYDLCELAEYYKRFDRLCSHWRSTLADRFMEVEYEKLVRDPEPVVAQMLGFCGLPFESGCLDITRNDAPVSTASSTQVREPINSRAIGAWRKYENFLGPLRDGLGLKGAA